MFCLEAEKQAIIDKTETNLVALRRVIYLTVQSSLDVNECAHKMLKMDLKPGQEVMNFCVLGSKFNVWVIIMLFIYFVFVASSEFSSCKMIHAVQKIFKKRLQNQTFLLQGNIDMNIFALIHFILNLDTFL